MALMQRIVIVGLGSIGRRHSRLLSARGDISVEWCESLQSSVEVAKEELGNPAKIHSSFGEMLVTRPDMVVIATPHACHAEQSCAALAAGIHVLCEKPLSDSLEGARAIASAVKESSAIFTVGFQLHFHPALRKIHDLIRSGELGSIHHAHCLVGTYITLMNSRSRYQRDLEGALFLDYAHQPDILFWLLGKIPKGVYAVGGQGGSLPLQSNPNFAAISCDYSEALISTTHLNYLQFPEKHEYQIVGDKAWVTFDLNTGKMHIGRNGVDTVETEDFSPQRDHFYQAEHQAFLDAIAGKRTPESPVEDALISMQVVTAAMESIRSRQRIPLESI